MYQQLCSYDGLDKVIIFSNVQFMPLASREKNFSTTEFLDIKALSKDGKSNYFELLTLVFYVRQMRWLPLATVVIL